MNQMKSIIFAMALFWSVVGFAAPKEIAVGVNGMVCGFCAQGISKKFQKEAAVEKVKVSLESKLVTLQLKDGQDITDSTITSLLKDSGYSVSKIDRK